MWRRQRRKWRVSRSDIGWYPTSSTDNVYRAKGRRSSSISSDVRQLAWLSFVVVRAVDWIRPVVWRGNTCEGGVTYIYDRAWIPRCCWSFRMATRLLLLQIVTLCSVRAWTWFRHICCRGRCRTCRSLEYSFTTLVDYRLLDDFWQRWNRDRLHTKVRSVCDRAWVDSGLSFNSLSAQGLTSAVSKPK